MTYKVKLTSHFKKDLKKAIKQHRNIEKLKNIVDVLRNGLPLQPIYRDHQLSGQYSNCRECHIEPDWLLIYEYNNNQLILTLLRVGSHSNLFK